MTERSSGGKSRPAELEKIVLLIRNLPNEFPYTAACTIHAQGPSLTTLDSATHASGAGTGTASAAPSHRQRDAPRRLTEPRVGGAPRMGPAPAARRPHPLAARPPAHPRARSQASSRQAAKQKKRISSSRPAASLSRFRGSKERGKVLVFAASSDYRLDGRYTTS